MKRTAILLALLALQAAAVPETAVVCASRRDLNCPQDLALPYDKDCPGSPTPELTSCGYSQGDIVAGDIVPVPPGMPRCELAVLLPLERGPSERCLTEAFGSYQRCRVLCPSERAALVEIHSDSFESGDLSAWTAAVP